MKPGKQILLVLSCGGMEITWRYAWAFFVTLLILNRLWPLPETLAVFTLGSVVTILSSHRCQRVYQSLALHFFGFALAWLLTVYRIYYQHRPFFSFSWMVEWFGEHLNPKQWFNKKPQHPGEF